MLKLENHLIDKLGHILIALTLIYRRCRLNQIKISLSKYKNNFQFY